MNLQRIYSSYFEYNIEHRWETHSLIPVNVVWWEDRALLLELLIHQIYEDGIRGNTYSELWRSI
jgi:hypothetical protein